MSHESNLEAMPYFVKPSLPLSETDKEAAYQQAIQLLIAVLEGENNHILLMSTINCLLKTKLPYYYWAGFYLVNDGRLSVGPYQGTIGCLHIDFGKGVCGRVAQIQQTIIVLDTHVLSEGKEHITCDSNSRSEIVVPVFGKQEQLIAVFDVDSTLSNSFSNID